MTEIEIKVSLKQDEFEKFINHYKETVIDVLEQWNIFFTTDATLNRSARLRRIVHLDKSVEWVFTTKGKGKIVDGVSVHSEIEDHLTVEQAHMMLKDTDHLYQYMTPQIQKYFQQFNRSHFRIDGDFKSIRTIIPFHGLNIEADKSIYPDGNIYYELELETDQPSEMREMLDQALQQLGIPSINSTDSKLAKLLQIPENVRFSDGLKEYIASM